jgi:hypothetical protein
MSPVRTEKKLDRFFEHCRQRAMDRAELAAQPSLVRPRGAYLNVRSGEEGSAVDRVTTHIQAR